MNTAHSRKAKTLAASVTALTGFGLVVTTAPAQAAPAAGRATVAPAQVQTAQPSRAALKSAVVVYRSGRVAASASISAAPKFTPVKKKVKKKNRSRRS